MLLAHHAQGTLVLAHVLEALLTDAHVCLPVHQCGNLEGVDMLVAPRPLVIVLKVELVNNVGDLFHKALDVWVILLLRHRPSEEVAVIIKGDYHFCGSPASLYIGLASKACHEVVHDHSCGL